VTGTGTTNTLPKFTGSTTIGNSLFTDNGTNGAFGGANYSGGTDVRTFNISAPLYAGIGFWANNQYAADIFGYGVTGNLILTADPTNVFSSTKIALAVDGTERFAVFNNGNVTIANSPTDAGYKLDVNGTGRFTSSVTATELYLSTSNGLVGNINSSNANGGYLTWQTSGTTIADLGTAQQIFGAGGNDTFGINGRGARAIAFGTNNTERMRITSGGNVGIGTDSPVQKLHVEGSAAIGTTGTEDILLLGRALSGGVSFQQAASLKLGRYQNAGGGYESYTRLDFALRDNSAASNYNTNTTVMTLTNAGNVGIGTTTPTVKLFVSNAANGNIAVFTNTSDADLLVNLTSGVTLLSPSTGTLALGTSSTERMRITSGGNVGIGTNNPAQKFSVEGEIAKYCGVGGVDGSFENLIKYGFAADLQSGAGPANRWVGIDATVTAGSAVVNTLRIRAYSGGTGNAAPVNVADFRGDQSSTFYGNVLIGTTTDSGAKLQVSGDVTITGGYQGRYHRIFEASGQRGGFYPYNVVSGGGADYSIGLFSESELFFLSGGGVTKRMVIANGGNVLIGTTTDSGDKLRVDGNTFTNTIMTWNPQNDNRSGVAWRLGAATIGTDTLNRRLRVNVGGVEYYIGAVEV
jgi:hypothetical protein